MLIKLLKQLISIPSYVDQDNDERLIGDFIFNYFKENCPWFKMEKQKVNGKRFNLIITDKFEPKIIFVCHMDTVKPVGDKKEMLTPKIINNKIYGLGAADMKGGIACLMDALKNSEPTKGISIIFDCDEEYYFLGIKKILEKYRFKPQLVICPEPTDLKIINGCRGVVEIEFDILGKTGHASNPNLGINAIEKSMMLINLLKKKIGKGSNNNLGKTSVNLSAIKGGRNLNNKITIQANAIPDITWVILDIRTADLNLNAKEIFEDIERLGKLIGVKIKNKKINLDYPSYISDVKNIPFFIKVIREIVGKIEYEKIDTVGFYEGSLIANKWRCPTISFGPSKAKTSHTKEECADIKSLYRLKTIFKSLINKI